MNKLATLNKQSYMRNKDGGSVTSTFLHPKYHEIKISITINSNSSYKFLFPLPDKFSIILTGLNDNKQNYSFIFFSLRCTRLFPNDTFIKLLFDIVEVIWISFVCWRSVELSCDDIRDLYFLYVFV